MLSSDYQAFGQSILLSMKDIFSHKEIPKINFTNKEISPKTVIINEVEKKIGKDDKVKGIPKSTKNEKVYFKFPEIQST